MSRSSDDIVDCRLTPRVARFYSVVPMRHDDGVLVVGTADPDDSALRAELQTLVGGRVVLEAMPAVEIERELRRRYGVGGSAADGLDRDGDASASVTAPKVQDITHAGKSASIVNWVNELLLQAYQDRATDVHFEPSEGRFGVRFRIDGVLYDIPVPPSVMRMHEAVASRVKVMANLDLGERRLPQDGRIKVHVGGRDLDLRISILPTLHGEGVDIRFLDNAAVAGGLDELGMGGRDLEVMEELLARPHGVILVSGPTGSGKTTTLYTALCRLRSSEKKILTIEDPVEYELDGITQIQVQSSIGLSFATGLRSMLRHDPDIMMVGEIRDEETAEVTIQVALTGHLVFSTVHTNDAASSVSRLANMGVEPYLLASCVQCVIAQRLVRVLCPHCKREIIDAPIVDGHGDVVLLRHWEPQGCPRCNGIGYRGRTGIYELLLVDEDIRDLIQHGESARRIKQVARRQGMMTLREAGLEKARDGITSWTEVLRVTQEESDDQAGGMSDASAGVS